MYQKRKRAKPSAPFTLRLNLEDADRLADLCEEVGKSIADTLETLVLYALDHARVGDVVRKELIFDDAQNGG